VVLASRRTLGLLYVEFVDADHLLMAKYQVRRIAVTAEDDRLVGVVSQADVALQGKDKDTGQVVEVISQQPRGPRTD
jgi:CBS-domain-containing membrane protein